ncbi:helix-turn-helix domain-containing protein [Pantoea sp. Ap-967]|uniref:GlxA family transcriptional regulator n=1 Tax=Pantoea sp. Ap-967 TaxID=2608362 RepID=UPI00141F1A2F|nr:helix-turn-helix domain-containing protein [Pantoea sp. Ap-967]NIE75900.1 helix-turn-helix domain-containing protein [Pantoea sp. Ap-967]
MKNTTRCFSTKFEERNLRFVSSEAPNRTSRIGFLLLENFSLPSFTQALDAVVTANLIVPGTTKVHVFSQTNSEVMSDLSIPIRPDTPLTDVRVADLDLMVVCGGLRSSRNVPGWLSTLLKRLSTTSIALGGLWNGAWYLGRAGLLDGYRCAIHAEQRIALYERSPNINVTLDSMVFDRDRLTAATPTGAFQAMISWLRERCNARLADAVLDLLDYDQSKFKSITKSRHPNLTKPLREVVTLMESNLEDPLDPEQIAKCLGLSTRQIQRQFREQMATTPQKYYLQLRITEARRLLQNSNFSVAQVGLACGFPSSTHFSRCYSSFFGHPPSKEVRYEI